MSKKDKKEFSSREKVIPVLKLLFSITAKKFPFFFPLEAVKSIVIAGKALLPVIVSPMIIDELIGDRDLKTLITLAAILVGGEFILGVLQERISNQLMKYQQRLDNHFNILTGLHSMELDFQLTEDKEALDQVEKARTGMDWYSGGAYGIAEQIFGAVSNVLRVFGLVTIISINAPILLLVILAYVIVMGFVSAKNNKIGLEVYKKLAKINRLFGYYGWNIVDFRYGKDIRLYDARKMMVDCWDRNSAASNEHWKWQAETGMKYYLIGDVANILRMIGSYLYVGFLAIKGVFSLGVLVQMIQAADELNNTLGGLVYNAQEVLKRCNYAYEFVLFMEYPEALEKGERAVDKEIREIEFKNVSFKYPGTDKMVLDNISIKIGAGEHLSIVGLNGAGKTTFIKLLCRLYDPTSGEILVNGINIKEYDYDQYMSLFAPVFQDFRLFAFPIEENITLIDEDDKDYYTVEEEKRIEKVIDMVNLKGMMDKLEKSRKTMLFKYFDETGIEPSGGEQQKIAIARAYYKNSPVVILDEPTAALDPIAEYEIYKQFHTLVGDKTAFYISHRLSSCRFCDTIAVFSEGKIAEYGNHDSLIKIVGGIYAGMFEAQAQYYR
ncbi:MAG: ABC transporter ATP-binding protein/permease [Lachnospiraceae bacterium]|nr:ABC transporter ATP-binding protein/permease [Lachnospiraceae bacterium]